MLSKVVSLKQWIFELQMICSDPSLELAPRFPVAATVENWGGCCIGVFNADTASFEY